MRHLFLSAAVVAGLCQLPVTAQQQRQVPIAEGVMIVAPDAECPQGTVRRVHSGQQQVAQQGYGQSTIHYCVAATLAVPEPGTTGAEDAKTAPAFPTLLPLSSFGPEGTNSDTLLSVLTPDELAALTAVIGGIEFAGYRLSGCHDRAHAAYMLLPKALQAKAVKQWVVAPSAYTRGVRGAIRYPADSKVEWRYHVALAFPTADGVLFFDPSLSPGKLLTEGQWLGSFDYPPLSMRFFAPAETYLFYGEDSDVKALHQKRSYIANKDIWVGNGFRYEGTSRNDHWIPNALARDAVGVRVEDGSACAALRALSGKPDDLLAALTGRTAAGCTAEMALFDQVRAQWIERLK